MTGLISRLFAQGTLLIMGFGTDVMKDIFDGIVSIFSNLLAAGMKFVIEYIIVQFPVDTSAFIEFIGSENLNKVEGITQSIGIALATIIFVWGLFLCAFGNLDEVRDTPLKLLCRYFIAICLVLTVGETFRICLMAPASAAYKLIGEVDVSGFNYEDWYKNLYQDYVNNSGINIGEDLDAWGFEILFAIITIIMSVSILINFIKFAIQIVERYVAMCLEFLFAPIAVSCVASYVTCGVSKAYLKMFISEIVMLVLNRILVFIFYSIMFSGIWLNRGFIGFCFTLAYLKIAQKLDSYLHSLGMNTPQAAGNAFYETIATMHIMQGMSRGIKDTGQKLGHVVGVMGSRDGDYGMAKFGFHLENMLGGRNGRGDTFVADSIRHSVNPEKEMSNRAAAQIARDILRQSPAEGYRQASLLTQPQQQMFFDGLRSNMKLHGVMEGANAEIGNGTIPSAGKIGSVGFSGVRIRADGKMDGVMNYEYAGAGGDIRMGAEPVVMTTDKADYDHMTFGRFEDDAGNVYSVMDAHDLTSQIQGMESQGEGRAENPLFMAALDEAVDTRGYGVLSGLDHDIQRQVIEEHLGDFSYCEDLSDSTREFMHSAEMVSTDRTGNISFVNTYPSDRYDSLGQNTGENAKLEAVVLSSAHDGRNADYAGSMKDKKGRTLYAYRKGDYEGKHGERRKSSPGIRKRKEKDSPFE